MFLNKIFYTFKPLIPRRLQIALRRQIARYKRKRCSHIWPIDPSSNKPPNGWNGWPDGKKFALVLSHDVDTKRGQDRVKVLAEIEMELGFRSAFNFVPERYVNHNSLRDDLKGNGFEIDVHGLKHDGKLFMNRKLFEQRAVKINEYLKAWGTTGFTAPSMHSRHGWLHAMDITHSISTFDTDPFEPQSDAAATIFPHSIYRNSSGNAASQPPSLSASQPHDYYIELPYTLPQDHLLFTILKEKSIDIWKKKLDWIAEHGGMALLNTHTDYMRFDGEESEIETYPVEYYTEFLDYINRNYKDRYWHVLPNAMAGFWKENLVECNS